MMNPTQNRPTVATLLVAFLVSLLNAGLTLIPASVPPELVASGYTLAVAVIAIAVGKAAQGQFLGGWLGETAPWSHDAHVAAVEQARREGQVTTTDG
jgi:hypothetical protein